jgi:predicted SAM-dependent methyltransferase
MNPLKQIAKVVLRETRLRAYKARRRAEVALHRVAPTEAMRPLPVNHDGRVLLHLGCGPVDAPGFTNVDAQYSPHLHYVLDVRKLTPFADESVDLVYACHVLEHFSAAEHHEILWEWVRVLAPGGVLRLSVPGFDELLHVYRECGNDVMAIVGPLMGTPGNVSGYAPHLHVFNLKYATKMMHEAGLQDVRQWDPEKVEHHDFEDWASRRVQRGRKQFDISLNVEATRPHAR